MEETDRKLIHDWIAILLKEASQGAVALNPSSLMKCSDAHYRLANMERTLEPLRGNLLKFIEYLEETMGWVIHHDIHQRVIVADENKPGCVCPLYKQGIIDDPLLCECSRGFAGRMFSYVTGHEVEAEVMQSVIRGGKTCKYKIAY